MHRHHAEAAATSGIKPRFKEAPGDRPPILPRTALAAGVAWGLLTIFIAVEMALLLPYVTGASPTAYRYYVIVLGTAYAVPIFVGLRNGKLWAVQLFKATSYIMAGFCLPILVATFYLWSNQAALEVDSLAPDLAIVFWIFTGLELFGFFILFRALRRVRWLDPKSLPHEWEPPVNLRR